MGVKTLLLMSLAFGSAAAYGSMDLVWSDGLPSAYRSSRVAQLGNALGYYLPRLSALEPRS